MLIKNLNHHMTNHCESNEIFVICSGTALILAEMPLDQVTNGLRQLCAIQISPLQQVSSPQTIHSRFELFPALF